MPESCFKIFTSQTVLVAVLVTVLPDASKRLTFSKENAVVQESLTVGRKKKVRITPFLVPFVPAKLTRIRFTAYVGLLWYPYVFDDTSIYNSYYDENKKGG